MYLMHLYNHHGNIYDCQLLSQIFVELVRFLRLVWSHASPAPGDTSSLCLASPSATNVQNRSAIHPWILPASSCPLLLLQMFRRGQLSLRPPWLGLDTFHRMLTQFPSWAVPAVVHWKAFTVNKFVFLCVEIWRVSLSQSNTHEANQTNKYCYIIAHFGGCNDLYPFLIRI